MFFLLKSERGLICIAPSAPAQQATGPLRVELIARGKSIWERRDVHAHICICLYVLYVYIYIYIHTYIHTYIERERERYNNIYVYMYGGGQE